MRTPWISPMLLRHLPATAFIVNIPLVNDRRLTLSGPLSVGEPERVTVIPGPDTNFGKFTDVIIAPPA